MEARGARGLAPPGRGADAAAGRWAGLARTAPGAPAVEAEGAIGLCCAGCGRTPVVGEWATAYPSRRGEVWLCELCESRPRRGELGHPLHRVRVRSAAASNVRRLE